ncbi:MAG: pyruvate carboxyltransferase, partial [Opitutales bacterium]|nr:pyruvate carboxyltransferase [Opitutales bacterium]
DPISCRPADLHKPRMDDLRKELKENNLPTDDEHCVIYAMFPQQVKELYFPPKEEPKPAPAPAAAPVATAATPAISARASVSGNVTNLSMTVNGTAHTVTVEEIA